MAENRERNFKSEAHERGARTITKSIPSMYIDPVVMGVSDIKPSMASKGDGIQVIISRLADSDFANDTRMYNIPI
jgi:hypothetical protein